MVANLKDLPRHYYSLEEYFALEKVGEARYEYWDGEIVCMSGGTKQHAIITSNIHGEFKAKLKGSKCRAFTEGMPIFTPSLPPYRYPDVSVVCGEMKFESLQGIDALVNPTLVVEVLSATTEKVDRNEKRAAYQSHPALQEYLLVSQTAHHVTRYTRHGQFWHREEISGLTSRLEFPQLHCEISLSDIYEGVVFP
ncbi:MAG: Uma2 family endonuclease [Blastocatellia bacterium]